MRLPILTIERVAPFFWVSLGPREARAFGVPVVQHFDGVAVEDGDDGTGEVCRDSGAGEQLQRGSMALHAIRLREPLRGADTSSSDGCGFDRG